MGLIRDLASGPVGLDTPIFIYLLEEHPAYLNVVRPVFVAIAGGTLTGVTSALTLLETLVLPYRCGNAPLAGRYHDFLTRSHGLRMDPITNVVLDAAAQLRASHCIKTPDAIQLATALIARCPVYLTNDRDLHRIPGVRILQVKSYLPPLRGRV
jgi:predicted nucleic acid-binding protein